MAMHQSPPPPLPNLWLLSDRRNDGGLETALQRLPRGSGFVYRHYHLSGAERRARYDALREACRARGHVLVVAGDSGTAAEWSADGVYGKAGSLGPHAALLRLATAHDAHEIALADGARADAIFLSPVFPTRSHPGAEGLGKAGFLALAAQAQAPVIALGGMSAARAADLGWPRWAAIDGLS